MLPLSPSSGPSPPSGRRIAIVPDIFWTTSLGWELGTPFYNLKVDQKFQRIDKAHSAEGNQYNFLKEMQTWKKPMKTF